MICPACAHTHFQPTRIEGGLPAERCEACGGVLVELERYRAWRKGFRIVEIPIVFTDRVEGQSKMSKRIVREAVWMVWSLRFRALIGTL